MEHSDVILLAVLAGAITLGILWALLGPRRRADESGHHVDLAERTRQRDLERRMRGERTDDSGRSD